jgi:hypothetical protein
MTAIEFNPFDQYGALRRDVSEIEISQMSDDLRPKYLALVEAALNAEDGEAQLKADEIALYAAVDAARVSRETLESVVPKVSFLDCWKANLVARQKEH